MAPHGARRKTRIAVSLRPRPRTAPLVPADPPILVRAYAIPAPRRALPAESVARRRARARPHRPSFARWVCGTTKCAGHEPQPVKTRLESPNALRPRPFARIRSRSMRLLTRTYRLTEPNRGVPSGPVDRSAVGPRARAGGDEPKQHGRERSVGRMATRGYRRRALSAAPSNSLIIPPGGVSHGGEQGPSIVRIAYAEKSSRCQCML